MRTKIQRGIITPTKRKAKAPPMFTLDEQTTLAQAIQSTWQRIGADAEQGCDGDNMCAVEVCIDADRLTLDCGYGRSASLTGQMADDLIKQALKVHSYDKVLKVLSNLVSLV